MDAQEELALHRYGQAHDISIEGITCVVRSRTWQNQMKDSSGIRFDNFKTIGANKGNANADGMGWLGGGDTVVHDSFFRAADDVFSMESSWEGYGAQAFAVEGSPVTNIRVEERVLSTSISSVVLAGWPEKNFMGGGFSMVNSDVIHAGLGGCGIPFALMEFWADP
jgi:polygalacturonase